MHDTLVALIAGAVGAAATLTQIAVIGWRRRRAESWRRIEQRLKG